MYSASSSLTEKLRLKVNEIFKRASRLLPFIDYEINLKEAINLYKRALRVCDAVNIQFFILKLRFLLSKN